MVTTPVPPREYARILRERAETAAVIEALRDAGVLRDALRVAYGSLDEFQKRRVNRRVKELRGEPQDDLGMRYALAALDFPKHFPTIADAIERARKSESS